MVKLMTNNDQSQKLEICPYIEFTYVRILKLEFDNIWYFFYTKRLI